MRGERFASASSSNATMLLRRFAGRLGNVMPRSRRKPRIWLITAVRRCTSRSLGEGDAALEEEAADLVDHRRTALSQPVAHPVESLQVELFVGLDGNKPHVLPRNRFGDGLRVEKVVLVRLEKWLYELRRD